MNLTSNAEVDCETAPKRRRGIRAARGALIVCAGASAIWAGVICWRPFSDSLGAAMLFVLGSFIFAPGVTATSILATHRLFRARSIAQIKFTATDTVFLLFGLVLSLLGVALCLRMAYGLASGTHG